MGDNIGIVLEPTSSFLFLVEMHLVTSSVLATSSDALCY